MKLRHSKSRRESGYILLSVMLLVTLMLITLSIEAPRIAQEIKREKEEELMHRGNEYKNAIRKYFRRFGQYPTSLDQLEKASNMRFLRKRYKDPFTGKDDWRLFHQGEIQVNAATGGVNGLGQQSGQISNGLGQPGAPQGNSLGQSLMGNSIGLSPGQFNTPGQTSGFGSTINQPSSGFGSTLGQSGTFGAAPATGTQPSQPGQPGTDPNAPGTNNSGISAASSLATGNSPVLGGGPIIGVGSISKLKSIKIVDGKDHYNEWTPFFYDPRLDTQTAGVGPGSGANPIGTPAGGLNQGQSPGAGTGIGAPTTGNSPGMGAPRIQN